MPIRFKFEQSQKLLAPVLEASKTFSDNKNLILTFILEKEYIVKEIIESKLSNETIIQTFPQISKIRSKLDKKYQRLVEGNDDVFVDEDLSEDEVRILVSSLELLVNGQALTENEEHLSVNELKIQENSVTIVTIIFNINKGIEAFQANNSKIHQNMEQNIEILQKDDMYGTRSKIRVAFIGLDTSRIASDLLNNLQTKRNFWRTEIDIVYCWEEPTTPTKQELKLQKFINSINLFNVDCFFVCSNDSFPPFLGDYLKTALDSDISVVFTMFSISKFANLGVCGEIEDEIPCDKGKAVSNDGPFQLVGVDPKHPFLKNVSIFDGGKHSSRANVRMRDPQTNDEKIEVIATWNDPKKTPLIITKENPGCGKIVVLNFWPFSSKVERDNWNSETDGDVIIQNSIIWASTKQS